MWTGDNGTDIKGGMYVIKNKVLLEIRYSEIEKRYISQDAFLLLP